MHEKSLLEMRGIFKSFPPERLENRRRLERQDDAQQKPDANRNGESTVTRPLERQQKVPHAELPRMHQRPQRTGDALPEKGKALLPIPCVPGGRLPDAGEKAHQRNCANAVFNAVESASESAAP